ncbi:MAG: hypothetical protein KBD73_01475 [Candidatus Magasanikbacteria bacterium]|nr:hypothetical protein [Candidatus Magasanikbacteria bacterium]
MQQQNKASYFLNASQSSTSAQTAADALVYYYLLAGIGLLVAVFLFTINI